MLDKIKNLNPWILALFIAIGVEIIFSLISTVVGFNTRQFFGDMGLIFALPSLKIAGYETAQSINNFSGEPADVSRFAEYAVKTGISVFMIFILGPFLLLKGYVQADASENSKKRSWTWYIGAVTIIMMLVPALLSATVGTAVHLNTRESTENSRQRDQLRSQLMNMALDSSYLIFASKDKGGGEGSFKSFGEDSNPATLQDLDSYDTESKFEFQIHGEVSDSTLTIVGISNRPGKDDDFENINGETGRQQVSVKVTPYQENIFQMQSSGPLSN